MINRQYTFKLAESSYKSDLIEANQALINAEVNLERAQIYDSSHSEKLQNDFQDGVFDSVKRVFHIDKLNPETRTRADLIEIIARLEMIAGTLRDEISDGAYDAWLDADN